MTSRRLFTAGLGLALLAPIAAPGSALGAPATDPVVSRAVSYLRSQQEADGGFELADFAGFETPDAIFALASAAQVGADWSPAAARAAVTGVKASSGKDPLDAIDDLVDGVEDPTTDAAGAQAAKLIALVVNPLGESATDFDPSGDSAAPVDLLARVTSHRADDGSFDFGAQFNGALYTAIALAGLGQQVPVGLISQIEAAQRDDGSWNFAGDHAADSTGELDTSAVAILALSAAGLGLSNPTVRAGARFLASSQQPNGAWQAFGADDANATALASITFSALHLDLTTSAWRSRIPGVAVGGAYASPYAWLATQQDASGRILSPNDSYGINTFPTSQTIEALARQWYLSVDRADLVQAMTRVLAASDAVPAGAATDQIGSDALGPNPAIRSAREAAARAVLASVPGRQVAASELYRRAFGRGLDASGRAFWTAHLATISRPEMLSRLTGSSEFYRLAGGTTETFVDAVYRSVLGRAPEPAGRAYWVARIGAGASVESVARSLVLSHEYRGLQVDEAYQRILDRRPDAAGREHWAGRLTSTRVEVILAGLAGSAEFFDLVTR